MNRITLLTPDKLDREQKQLYDELEKYTEGHYGGKFVYRNQEGQFLGPFGVLLHSAQLGIPFLNFANALRAFQLPPSVRECAILGVAFRTQAQYEAYAHQKVSGFDSADLVEMEHGRIPPSYSEQERAAYSLAIALGRPGPLPQTEYDRFQEVLGTKWLHGVVHLTGFYTYVSTILNAFDMKAPSSERD